MKSFKQFFIFIYIYFYSYNFVIDMRKPLCTKHSGFLCIFFLSGQGDSDKLFDFGALTDSVTQIVELASAYLTCSDKLDLINIG